MVKVRYTSDISFVNAMKKSVADNDGYCPCRITKSEATRCMCKEFRDFINAGKIGTCHCGLYETYNP